MFWSAAMDFSPLQTAMSTLGQVQSPTQRLLASVPQKVKRPEPEADHSPPFNAKAQNKCSYKPTTGLHGLYMQNFSFIFKVNVN